MIGPSLSFEMEVTDDLGLPFEAFLDSWDEYVESGYWPSDYVAAGGPATELAWRLDIDDTISDSAAPVPGTVVETGVEIYVDGVLIPMNRQISGSLDLAGDRSVQVGQFQVIVDESTGAPLGGALGVDLPVAGKAQIDVYGIYRTSTGVKRIPVITNGVAELASRDRTEQGTIETWTISDGGGRLRKKVTMILPVGHGLKRSRIVELLLEKAGETSHKISQDSQVCLKELQVLDADAITTANQLLDVEGKILQWGSDGIVRDVFIGRDEASPVAATYSEKHVIGPSNRQTPQGALTRVVLSGYRKVTAGEADPDGFVTDEFTSILMEIRGQLAFEGKQNADGSLTDLSPEDPGDVERIVRKIVTKRTSLAGVTVREYSETFELYAPEAARYAWNSGTTNWDAIAGVYVQGGTSAGDQNPAYAWPAVRWIKVGEIERRHFYDAPGFREANVPGPDSDAFVGTSGDGTGNKLGTQTTVKTYYNYRKALKNGPLPASTSWEEVDYTNGVKRLGSFEGVADGQESLQLTERITQVFSADDGGLLTKAITYREAPVARPGDGYWYGGDIVSRDSQQVFAVVDTLTESWQSGVDGYHRHTTDERGVDGVLIQNKSEDALGAPPAVEMLPFLTPEERAGVPQEVLDSYTPHRLISQPMSAVVDASQLEDLYPPDSLQTSLDYAENEEELLKAAEIIQDESTPDFVNWTVPVNWLLRPHDVVQLTHRPLDVNADRIKLHAVGFQWAWGQPILTTLIGKLYLEEEAA